MPKFDQVVVSDEVHARLVERIKRAADGDVSTADAIEGVLRAGLDALDFDEAVSEATNAPRATTRKASGKGRRK